MAAGVVGSPKDFFRKFSFEVQIPGFASAAFQDCSELSHEVGNIEYYEGGAVSPINLPARVKVSDLTLNRSATVDQDMYVWARQVVDILANGGLIDPSYKRTIDIVQKDRDGTSVLARWRCFGCYPSKFVGGAWDNNADELTMESLTLKVDAYTRVA